MKEDIKRQWVAALRSGEFKQGIDFLNGRNGEYCCLGVLCELAVRAGVVDKTFHEGFGHTMFDDKDATLPHRVSTWAGLLDNNDPSEVWIEAEDQTLTRLNDSGVKFTDIADIIEEQL